MAYKVQPGDTLNGIAQKMGTTANNLTGYRSGNPNLIMPGEQISLKTPSSATVLPQPSSARVMPQQASSAQVMPNVPSARVAPTQPGPTNVQNDPIHRVNQLMGVVSQNTSTTPDWQTQATQTPRNPGFAQNVKNAVIPPAYAEKPAAPTAGSKKFNVAKPRPDIPDWAWDQVVQGAEASAKKYGIPASVTIAQFLQETGGNPAHFIGGTNVFGQKGSGTAGSVNVPTTEYINGVPVIVNANFAKYNNIAESVEAHGKNLAENPAYAKLQKLIQNGNNNPFDIANALQGVYATDPNYAKSLQNLITTYGLAHADDYNKYPVQNNVTKIRQDARKLSGGTPTSGGSARLG